MSGGPLRGSAFFSAVILCFLVSIFFAVCFFPRRGRLSDIRLQDKINPNEAPVGSLVRLPGIGFTRAQAIVFYRQWFAGDKEAFAGPEDLKRVKGIGDKTAAKIAGRLRFE